MEETTNSVQSDKSSVTRLLLRLQNGDEKALQSLFSIVYENLLLIARNQLNKEGGDHTLNKTDLVHEAFFKLMEVSDTEWQNRGHFYAVAARAMRQILTDYARKKMAAKRGNKPQKIHFDDKVVDLYKQSAELIEINDALKDLFLTNERLGKIVELRFYAGLSTEETGKSLGISSRTVNREWIKARAWLYDRLHKDLGY